LARWELVMR